MQDIVEGGLQYYHQWDDFLEAAEALRYREKLDHLDVLLISSLPRDRKGVQRINQKISNLQHAYNSRITVVQKDEDVDAVWNAIHKAAGRN